MKWSRITSQSSISRWLETFNQASFLFLMPIIIYYKDKVKLAHEIFLSPPLTARGAGLPDLGSLCSLRELQLFSLENCSRNGTWGSLPWLGLLWAVQCMLRTNHSCVMQLLENWK